MRLFLLGPSCLARNFGKERGSPTLGRPFRLRRGTPDAAPRPPSPSPSPSPHRGLGAAPPAHARPLEGRNSVSGLRGRRSALGEAPDVARRWRPAAKLERRWRRRREAGAGAGAEAGASRPAGRQAAAARGSSPETGAAAMAESIVSAAGAGAGRRDEAADLPARPVGRRPAAGPPPASRPGLATSPPAAPRPPVLRAPPGACGAAGSGAGPVRGGGPGAGSRAGGGPSEPGRARCSLGSSPGRESSVWRGRCGLRGCKEGRHGR